MEILTDILHIIFVVIAAFLLFGFTVFVHEWGHFLAARLMGLYVDRFAIGFGPRVWSYKYNGVEYSINWIPFGGFVSLPQMAPMEMVEGETDESIPKDLPEISPFAKIVTAFAGPLFSFLLAVGFAIVLSITGIEKNTVVETKTIGYVLPNGPASKAGLQPGDVIQKINDSEIKSWSSGPNSVMHSIILSVGKTIDLEYERNGASHQVSIIPELNKDLEDLRAIGIKPAAKLIIKGFSDDSPSKDVGLQEGDVLLSANGIRMYSMDTLQDMIAANGSKPMQLTVLRGEKEIQVTTTPVQDLNSDPVRYYVGLVFQPGEKKTVYPDPMTQVSNSVILMGRTLKAVTSSESGVGVKHLSGPVGIFSRIIDFLKRDPRDLIAFCVFLNVNLALLNLLPIPVLDGGHITLALIELVTRRQPSVKILYALQTACVVALLGFILFVSYHDVGREIRGYQKGKKIEKELSERKPIKLAPAITGSENIEGLQESEENQNTKAEKVNDKVEDKSKSD